MQIKSRFFLVFAAGVMSVAAAQAGAITVAFDDADQTGVIGEDLQYWATITNTSSDTVFLNGDSPNLAGAPGDFDFNELFYSNAPFFLEAGDSADVELFDITIDPAFADSFGTYAGTYTIQGGVDANAQDTLNDPPASFSVTVTPEPGTSGLLLAGLSAAAFALRRRRR